METRSRIIVDDLNGKGDGAAKMAENFGLAMRRKLIQSLSIASLGDCPICIMAFQPDDKIIDLPCHVKHQVHAACFAEFKAFYKNNNKPILCPICRAPVEEDKCNEMTLPARDEKKEAMQEY